jgi:D-amino-acid dehydrogenase
MSKSKHVTIIGGGIIGLACAFFLNRQGHQVTVIDKNPIGDSCALGNAGYITASHFIPLAAPGMVQKGLKWMFNPESPFYIHPRFDLALIQWMWKFNLHCRKSHVDRVKNTLLQLCCESKQLYIELDKLLGHSFQLKQKGIYVVTQQQKQLQHELELVEQANAMGVNASEVTKADLQDKFPQLELDAVGGVFFPEDAHVHPGELLESLFGHLKSAGVEFIEKAEVTGIQLKSDKVQSIQLNRKDEKTQSTINVEELVIAGGSWSPQLIKALKLNLPIQAGKGYSVTIDKPWEIDTPIILSDSAVAITPFESQVRFGGTMELAGLDRTINPRRVNGIIKSVKRFIPNFDIDRVDQSQAWSGLRPCTPDGLPLVGRAPNLANLSVAAGHAMLGLTLAPVTGKIISEIITNGEQSNSIPAIWKKHLNVARFN